jgi:hypothetical protein
MANRRLNAAEDASRTIYPVGHPTYIRRAFAAIRGPDTEASRRQVPASASLEIAVCGSERRKGAHGSRLSTSNSGNLPKTHLTQRTFSDPDEPRMRVL